MSLCSFTIFFLFLIPLTHSLSFNLSSISPADANSFINITGDAYISNQGIQVTPDERNMALESKVGRATYIKPLHLWDKASGNLADFTTHFTFVIDSSGNFTYADGLAFFLAPAGSGIPSGGGGGGGIGLGREDSPANSSSESFVAVEFDTFENTWDPSGTHVGININSMNSVTTESWWNNVTQGMENDAWISYNADSKTLRVDFTGFSGNKFQQGSLSYVVDIRKYLPENVTFGFSAATGDFFEKNNVKSWEFSSTVPFDIISREPTPSPEPEPKPEPQITISGGKGKMGNKRGLAAGLGVGLSILILVSALASYFLWRKYKKELRDSHFFDQEMNNEFEKGSGPKKFSFKELACATDNFSEKVKIGEGGFGGVYRGFLRDTNSYVAVKKVSRGSKQGLKEYASEVKIISQLRHRNLVQLIGWCHKREELLLVYEFLPNGSLYSHIIQEKSVLTWEIRYKIAQGLASALLYLHEEWEQCVVHRDIKSSNIMLDSNFNAKLGDFGLARLVDHEKGSQTTVLAGTLGYMAPECTSTMRATKESDVYSFGVVLLEIACGRKPIDLRCQENEVRLVEWVWNFYGIGKLLDATDPKLCTEYDVQEMERLMVVGLWCVHPDNNHRPSIRQAINVLNAEAQLPSLPLMMPVATYTTPVMNTFTSSNDAHFSCVVDSETFMHYSNTSNITTSSAGSDPSAALLNLDVK